MYNLVSILKKLSKISKQVVDVPDNKGSFFVADFLFGEPVLCQIGLAKSS